MNDELHKFCSAQKIAATLTEALEWIVADTFYRMSQGEETEDIIDLIRDNNGEIEEMSNVLRFSKN